jgi:hypothetical protein
VAAGTAAQGADGWCDSTSNCKCQAQGAVCSSPYCSFTLPSQAPEAGSPTPDSGSVEDAGTHGVDAGVPEVDAGTPAVDAGTPPPAVEGGVDQDGGSLPPTSEAGVSAPDAGSAVTTCINDTDCPGTECGGQVCDWNLPVTVSGVHRYTCVPAGTAKQGMDGWCTTVDNCKCKAQGATCNAPYCSFTLPSGSGSADAAVSGSSSGSGSYTGASGSGSSGSGSSGGGCSTGGVDASWPWALPLAWATGAVVRGLRRRRRS